MKRGKEIEYVNPSYRKPKRRYKDTSATRQAARSLLSGYVQSRRPNEKE